MNDEQKELMRKIMELILRLETETTYGVMFDYSGHCNVVSIDLRKSKKEYEKFVFNTTFYYTGQLYVKTKIESIINVFETLLETGEFQGKALKKESVKVVVSQVKGSREIYSI